MRMNTDKKTALMLGFQVIFFIIIAMLLKTSMFFGFFAGLLVSIAVLLKKGYALDELLGAAHKAIIECKVIFIIILLMGAMISVWLASGTIPYIIYMGMTFIGGQNVVLMAFLLTGAVALTMGTALGAFSTIGIALLAIGKAYSVPVPLMMGAILSGAFISDKMAPVSGLVNLTLNLCDVTFKEYGKKALKTLVPVVFLAAVIYMVLGAPYVSDGMTAEVLNIHEKLNAHYTLTPILMILPVVVMGLALSGVTTVRTMSISLVIGSLFCVWLQKMPFGELGKTVLYGYHPTFDPLLADILSGGGVIPMLEVIFIIMTVLAISYIFEYTGVTEVLTKGLMKELDSVPKLYFRTGLLSLLMTSVTCDQSMGIIMPAKIFKPYFERFKKEPAILAQIIADTGIIIAPLEFWNVNALIITALTGVHALQYGPYTVLCYLTPLLWLVSVGMLNVTNSKERSENPSKGVR